MRVFLMVAVPVALLGGFTSASAQEDEPGYVQLVNEFFLNGSVYPQEQGEIQLTTYPRIDFDDGHRSAFPLAVELGLTDRWQLEAEWIPLAVNRPNGSAGRSGIGDVEIETQYSFMNLGGSSTHLAFGLGVTLPMGPEEAGGSEGETEFEPSISMARDVRAGGRPGQLFGQVAMGLVGREEGPVAIGDPEVDAHELILGLGYVVAAGRARWTAELSWASNEWNGGDETEVYFAPGLVWDLPETWELGIGAPIGLGGDAVPFGLSLFLLYEFELGDDD